MKKAFTVLACTVALCFTNTSYAIVNDTIKVIKDIQRQIADIKKYKYTYKMTAQSKSLGSKQIEGLLMLDKTGNTYYNENSQMTVYLSKKWLYRVDHEKKQIFIQDLSKKQNKSEIKTLVSQLFKSSDAINFLDAPYGNKWTVVRLVEDKDSYTIQVKYEYQGMFINISLTENLAEKKPKHIHVMYRPISTYQMSNDVEIDCNDFETNVDFPEQSKFFSISKGKVILNAFKNYKLTIK